MDNARPSARLNCQAGPFEVRDAAFEPFEACLQLPVLDELREVFFGRRDIEDIEEISRIELTVIRLARGDGVWPDNREIGVRRVRLPRRARIAVVPPEAPRPGSRTSRMPLGTSTSPRRTGIKYLSNWESAIHQSQILWVVWAISCSREAD